MCRRTAKVLTRLHGCAGWSGSLLFTYVLRSLFSAGPFISTLSPHLSGAIRVYALICIWSHEHPFGISGWSGCCTTFFLVYAYSRGLNALNSFSAICNKWDKFCVFLMFFLFIKHRINCPLLRERICFLFFSWWEQILPFRVAPFSKSEGCKNFDRIFFPENVFSPLKMPCLPL